MRRFKKPERDQMLLFAHVNLNRVAPPSSAVRIIDEMIEVLDTSKIEKEYNLGSITGRNPIHPKTIIKVALYALHNCRFSLRKMEMDTKDNLAYRWLTGNEAIDHSTIGKFLVQFRDYIEDIFTQTVIISTEKELLDFEVLAIDTVKIRANTSHKQDKNLNGIEKEENKVRSRIKDLLDGVENEANKIKEVEALKRREAKLSSAKKILKERLNNKCEGKKDSEKKKTEEKEKINITDTDSHKMQQANGEINPSYSISTTVDTKADIITHFQVNEEDNDNNALLPAIEGSKEKSGEKHNWIDADSGFFSMDNIERLLGLTQDALIPDKRFDVDERGNHKRGIYDRYYFKYIIEDDIYICPRGQTLNRSASFFLEGRLYYRYENLSACQNCLYKKDCCKGKKRTITRDANEKIKEAMRAKLKCEENKKIYSRRAHAAESPYGNIKHNLKFRIFMRRGRDKVKLEVGLLCILHNVMKIARYA